MKKTLSLIIVALTMLVQFPAAAQSKFSKATTKEDLVNNPAIKGEVEAKFKSFKDFMDVESKLAPGSKYAAGEYKRPYEGWHYVFHHAPLYSIDLYSKGRRMFEGLLQESSDFGDDFKLEAYKDMIKMYKTRLDNIDDLDAIYGDFFKEKGEPLPTRGDIKVWFEIDRYNFGKVLRDENGNPVANTEKSYARFHEAIEAVNKYGGRDLDAAFLYHLVMLSRERCLQDVSNNIVSFLDDYNMCYNLCDSLINEARKIQTAGGDKAKEKVNQILDRYVGTYYVIQDTCKNLLNKNIDSETLSLALDKGVEQHRNDEPYLRNLIVSLIRSNRDTIPAFYKAGRYAHDRKHSMWSCVAVGRSALNAKNYVEASRLFEEAIQYANDSVQRGSLAMIAATGMVNGGNYGAARAYLKKASDFSPMLRGQCEYLCAKTYYEEGMRHRRAGMESTSGETRYKEYRLAIGKYDEAMTHCNEAYRADASISANVENLMALVENNRARAKKWNDENPPRREPPVQKPEISDEDRFFGVTQ